MLRRAFSSTTAALRPEIKAGVIVKRAPLLLRQPTDYEIAYNNYQRQLSQQMDAPYRRDFFEAERMQRRVATQGDESSATQNDSHRVDYTPRSDPKVDADQSRSDRMMDRSLFLVVRKPRDRHAWQFPQGKSEGEESLRQTAERELKEECGDELRTWFVGQAPVAHMKYEYPDQKESCTVFFMKSNWLGGDVQVDGKEIVEHAWVTKDELSQLVSAEYYEAVKDALTDQ